MLRLRVRNKNRKALYSGWTLIVLLFVIFIVGRSTLSVSQKEKETKNNLNNANEELVELEDRRELLVKEIRKLSTERGVEEEIREKFRVVKSGEEMLMLIDGPETASSEEEEETGFWSKIFGN